jgi:hypothetical protein
LWIKQEPLAKEYHIQLKDLMDVLSFLFVPKHCYHITLEEYFEDPDVFLNRKPCHTHCTFCHGQHANATTTFWGWAFLVSFLSTKVFLLGPVPVAKLIKCLGNNKTKVFTTPTKDTMWRHQWHHHKGDGVLDRT